MLVFGFFFLVLSVRSHKYLIIAMTWRWRHSNEWDICQTRRHRLCHCCYGFLL